MNSHTEYKQFNIKHEIDPLSATQIKIELQDIESDVNTRQVNIKQENLPSEVVSCISTVCKVEDTKENLNNLLEDYQKIIHDKEENREEDETTHLSVQPDPCETYAEEEKHDMHIVDHIGDKTCISILCKTSLLEHNDLSTDMNTKISDKNLKYSSCTSNNYVHNHFTDLHLHKERKFFKCNICSKSFFRKYALTRHLYIHKVNKPYTCNICGKSFAYKQTITQHMYIHVGDKTFKCKICNKSFSRKSNLSDHMLTHTGKKPFTCEICKRSFTVKQTLVRHISTHTDDKPFTCSICKKSFSQKFCLVAHMCSHTGEKPFKCQFCSKSFSRKSRLVDHARVHANEETSISRDMKQ